MSTCWDHVLLVPRSRPIMISNNSISHLPLPTLFDETSVAIPSVYMSVLRYRSGISGSGKSVGASHIVAQLCRLAAHTKKEARVASQLQQAQQVLDAFGCVYTAENRNASMFSKFLEIQVKIMSVSPLHPVNERKEQLMTNPFSDRHSHTCCSLMSEVGSLEARLSATCSMAAGSLVYHKKKARSTYFIISSAPVQTLSPIRTRLC